MFSNWIYLFIQTYKFIYRFCITLLSLWSYIYNFGLNIVHQLLQGSGLFTYIKNSNNLQKSTNTVRYNRLIVITQPINPENKSKFRNFELPINISSRNNYTSNYIQKGPHEKIFDASSISLSLQNFFANVLKRIKIR